MSSSQPTITRGTIKHLRKIQCKWGKRWEIVVVG